MLEDMHSGAHRNGRVGVRMVGQVAPAQGVARDDVLDDIKDGAQSDMHDGTSVA